MTVTELIAELARHNVNYFIHYNCHSKRYRVTVPWLDVDVDDKELDVALRLVLIEISQEDRKKWLPTK